MYDAASVQPIVQGLLIVSGTTSNFPNTCTFQGRGVSAASRVTVGALITYVLTLDKGLPGNSGEVAAAGGVPTAADGVTPLTVPAGGGASSLTNVPTPDVRCSITIRGSSSNAAVKGGTDIVSSAVSYIAPGAKDSGFTQVQLVFSLIAAGVYASTDPTDTHASGVEIVIWQDPQRIN